jgi:hypothetical protein
LGKEEGSTPLEKSINGEKADVYPWNEGRGTWPPPKGAGNYRKSLQVIAFKPASKKRAGTPGVYMDVDSYDTTSPVGSFDKNQYGLYDMGGNVKEWCRDLWKDTQGSWILRGASWHENDNGSRGLRSSRRDFSVTDGPEIGFRVVVGAR